jgi:hypothetical protein
MEASHLWLGWARVEGLGVWNRLRRDEISVMLYLGTGFMSEVEFFLRRCIPMDLI